MRFIPIRDLHLAIRARDRDAWRARAEGIFDVEGLILACVPDAATCDPSVVADAIREWFDVARAIESRHGAANSF